MRELLKHHTARGMRQQRGTTSGGGGGRSSAAARRTRARPAAQTLAARAPSPPIAASQGDEAAAAALAAAAAAPERLPYRALALESPRVAAQDAQQRAMLHLQHGRQVAPKRGDSMAVRAVAEMVAAMKKVEVGVLDAERTAASERDLRKQTEARAAAAEARASDAEAERDRLRQEMEEWKAKALQHTQQEKESRERLDAAMEARAALEKQLSEVSAALAKSSAAQNGLEAELEMTRQQLQDAAAFAGWGQTPGRAALRWGSAEWWSGGGRVGASGTSAHGPRFTANQPFAAARATRTQAPTQGSPSQSTLLRGTDSASAAADRVMALEAEISAAAHERERLARDLDVALF